MGLGDSLKSWAKSKATEMLTADSQKAEAAGAEADAAERQAKDEVGEQLLRTAFPKLGEWQDQQKENERKAADRREQERRDEIAGLPSADVRLTVSGWTQDQWFGHLHYAWNEIAPEEPDPEYPDEDPTPPSRCCGSSCSPRTEPVQTSAATSSSTGASRSPATPATVPTTSPPSRKRGRRPAPH